MPFWDNLLALICCRSASYYDPDPIVQRLLDPRDEESGYLSVNNLTSENLLRQQQEDEYMKGIVQRCSDTMIDIRSVMPGTMDQVMQNWEFTRTEREEEYQKLVGTYRPPRFPKMEAMSVLKKDHPVGNGKEMVNNVGADGFGSAKKGRDEDFTIVTVRSQS